jgi:hypothetical protein
MRPLLAALLLLTAASAQVAKPGHLVHAPNISPALRPFVGTWRLVSSVETLPDGTSRPYGFGPHAAGYLMYDASGHVCAQVVDPDRPKWKDSDHPTPEELKAAFAGFGGYCGRFTVDAVAHTAAHIPEISFDPTLAGEPKPRSYRFEEGRLIYSGAEKIDTGGESHWTMTWERVK